MSKKLWYSLVSAALLLIMPAGCVSTPAPVGAKASLLDRATASVKSGTESVTGLFASKPAWTKEKVETEKERKIGPSVFVAAAQYSEGAGNLEEAEAKYQKALEVDPNDLHALMGYARLEDRQNNFEAAEKLYKQALKKHPKEASVHNDMGLCFQRHGMLAKSSSSLQKAVEMQPKKKLYRDNLATVLVEQNKNDEALKHLTVAHGEAVGHYNLAYLLTQRQQNAAALEHFHKAFEKDPTLNAAQQWIASLSNPGWSVGSAEHVAMTQRPAPLPPVDQGSNASFVANPSVVPAGQNQQLVRTSVMDNQSTPVQMSRPEMRVASRGVQFPPVRRPPNESASDAVAPAPPTAGEPTIGSGRLPTVVR